MYLSFCLQFMSWCVRNPLFFHVVCISRFVFLPSFLSLVITVHVCLFASFCFEVFGIATFYLLIKFVVLILLMWDSACLFSSVTMQPSCFSWCINDSNPVSLLPVSFYRIWRFAGRWLLLGLFHLMCITKGIGSSLGSLGPRSKQILVFPDDWCHSVVLSVTVMSSSDQALEISMGTDCLKKVNNLLRIFVTELDFLCVKVSVIKKKGRNEQWYKKKNTRHINDGKPNPLKSEM